MRRILCHFRRCHPSRSAQSGAKGAWRRRRVKTAWLVTFHSERSARAPAPADLNVSTNSVDLSEWSGKRGGGETARCVTAQVSIQDDILNFTSSRPDGNQRLGAQLRGTFKFIEMLTLAQNRHRTAAVKTSLALTQEYLRGCVLKHAKVYHINATCVPSHANVGFCVGRLFPTSPDARR